MRRLPVYLLIDTSGSMSGEPIEAVKNGMHMMQSALRKDPHALEQAFLSVITFDSDAKQLLPLTEVSQFQAPNLTASGTTSLGAALKLLVDCANSEVVKSTPEKKGDWKPLVFVFTDGEPSDDYRSGLVAFKANKWGIVVCCAAGGDVNTKVLSEIAGENVIQLATNDSNSIAAFFKFVSSSISASSKKVDSGSEPGSIGELPPPPPEISLAKI